MKRIIAVLTVLALVLCLASAMAAPRYPEKADTVSDLANVLSRETIDALTELNKTLSAKIGVTVNVVTVHFLDGEDIKSYAQTLFSNWEMNDNSILLLMAVGEDSFYTTAGSAINKKFPVDSREHLLSGAFETRFMAQDYDGALRSYVPELAQVLQKNYGVSITLPKYFGDAAAPKATAVPNYASVEDLFDNIPFFKETAPKESQVAKVERQSGMNAGKLLVLLLIFFLVFSPSRRVRKWGRAAGCAGCGCGCGPLSWLFALLGLSEWIKKK